ncbi:MAG TPA: dihydrolipoamide acetyltransferase family protein [Polyangiales bacterium]|nr:dihydrolipoamide acetyltransferase family protein [Polyangiales bacterium]
MPLFEFKLPDIGEGVAEGEVVAWHVAPGVQVQEDQEMVEVMTDKATVTIGAPHSGRIAQLCAKVGERVPVGSVLVVIDTGGAQVTPIPHKRSGSVPARSNGSVTASAVGDIRESLPGMGFLTRSFERAPAENNAVELEPPVEARRESAREPRVEHFAAKPLATPATRKLARDLGIDLRTVQPTGPNGRVTKDDLRARDASEPSALEERKPFVGLRRRIAERMQTSVQKAAHFTFVEEVDVGELKAMIERLKPQFELLGAKLHYLPFIVKAVTLALKKHPILNTVLDERSNELVYKNYFHIGIATATEQGLMVPVVRDADRKSPLQIARDIQRLSEGARAGKLPSSELSGSTFTITSLGKLGGLLATPVLNYPEVGILGVHAVKERPVVKNGQIVIGNVMLLSLSFDHRIIDGHIGAAFAYDVIAYLEQPELLLIELS